MQEMLKSAQKEVPEIPPPTWDTSGASAAGRETGKAFADGVKKGMTDEDADIQRRAEAKAAASFLGRRSGLDALRVLQLQGDTSRRGESRTPTELFPEPGFMSGFAANIPSALNYALGGMGGRGGVAFGNIDRDLLLGQQRGEATASRPLQVEHDPATRESADLLRNINDKLDG